MIELKRTPGLEMNPATHKYALEGVELPSVTQIMQSAGLVDFSHVPKDTLEAACQRGTVVHRLTELWDRKTINMATVDDVGNGYLGQWLAAKHAIIGQNDWTAIEVPLAIRGAFAGTLDRAYIDGRRLVIADIKTGIDNNAVDVQLTGYLELVLAALGLPGTRFDIELVCVALTEESYKITTYQPIHSVFTSARVIHNYKNRK